jgi:threonine synthase
MIRNRFIYKCTDCGSEYDSGNIMYLCPSCSGANTTSEPPAGVLSVLYDYPGVQKRNPGFNELKKTGFIDLLPVNSVESLPPLRVGNTPLYSMNTVGGEKVDFRLHLKDDSQNPTYSFKDRASALVSAYARENGLETIVTASTGNAGSSLAGICASQGQRAVVIVPEKAPLAKLTQIIMYGATLVPVRGTYDEAFDLSIRASSEFGWYNRNTAFNPLTVEGKKTVSFELFEQLKQSVPDRIFVPVGDGVIISGIYKGFEDLLMLKMIDRMPIIVAVQSEKSDNLVRNIPLKKFTVISSSTLADSIAVDIPRNFLMTRRYMQKYGGESATVTDEEILGASSLLSRTTGLFAEPAAAAAFAGLLSYHRDNRIRKKTDNVVMLTGCGLKDLKAVSGIISIPESIFPSIDELRSLLK